MKVSAIVTLRKEVKLNSERLQIAAQRDLSHGPGDEYGTRLPIPQLEAGDFKMVQIDLAGEGELFKLFAEQGFGVRIRRNISVVRMFDIQVVDHDFSLNQRQNGNAQFYIA